MPYDLLSPRRKPGVGGKASNLKKLQGKVAMHKVSLMSVFAHAASEVVDEAIGDHRAGFEEDPVVFRRRTGFKQ